MMTSGSRRPRLSFSLPLLLLASPIHAVQSWRYYPIRSGDRAAVDEEEQDWPYVGPGDRIITRCNYNTSLKTNVTRWVAGGWLALPVDHHLRRQAAVVIIGRATGPLLTSILTGGSRSQRMQPPTHASRSVLMA